NILRFEPLVEGNIVLEPCCISGRTEFFNGVEWKKIEDYSKGDKVLVWDKTGKAHLELPIKYIKTQATDFYCFSNHLLSYEVSREHRMIYFDYKNRLKEMTMGELFNRHYNDKCGFRGGTPTGWQYGDKSCLSEQELRLAIALSADGTLRTVSTNRWKISLKKERKIIRLKNLLKSLSLEYRETEDGDKKVFTFYYSKGVKLFPSEWLSMSDRLKEVFLEEVFHWDGSIGKNGDKTYFTKEKSNADFVQFIMHSSGMSSNFSEYDREERPNSSIEYRVALLSKNKTSMRRSSGRIDIEVVTPKETDFKYCFTVSTGMFVARLNNQPFITGNCGGGHMIMGIDSFLKANNLEDKVKVFGTDLVDRGFSDSRTVTGLDFLSDDYPFDKKADVIVMNPPYDLIEEFVLKSFGRANKIIMLARTQFAESKSRYENIFVSNPPSRIYQYVDRIACYKNGDFSKKQSSAQSYSWFVFEPNRREKTTEFFWIRREDKI
ncbi:hypothetical protein, partial [Clostridium sp.]|uniref:hypothetical protein n=1 Tax=Clostridium sp. TaxID=1506 RepID=UPI002FC6DAAD